MALVIFKEDSSKKRIRNRKGKSLLELHDDYVVLDLETTGLSPQWDTIIEVAAVRVSGNQVTNRFQSLINPMFRISSFITELTGITNEMLAEAPTIDEVLPAFISFVGEDIVVAHNANFDVNFLYDACEKCMNKAFVNDFVDTMRLSRRLFNEYAHHRLSDLIERFNIGDCVEHRAFSDVLQTQQCYEYIKAYIAEHRLQKNLDKEQ